jgi:hypothetical protein
VNRRAVCAQNQEPGCIAIESSRSLQAEAEPRIRNQLIEDRRLVEGVTARVAARLVQRNVNAVGRSLDQLSIQGDGQIRHELRGTAAGLTTEPDTLLPNQLLHLAAATDTGT